MKRTVLLIAALGATGTSSTLPSVCGADIGDRKTFTLAAERVTGFSHTTDTVDPDGPGDTTRNTNNLALFSQHDTASPYSNPRIAFDYFLTNGLSLGGTLGYWSRSGDVDPGGDLADQHLFTLGARLGFGVMFGKVVGIWPRGGLTFFTGETSVGFAGLNADANLSGLGLNLEVPLVIEPTNHFAILVGPGLDFTITAGGDAGPVEYDRKFQDVGLYVGFAGVL